MEGLNPYNVFCQKLQRLRHMAEGMKLRYKEKQFPMKKNIP